MKKKNWMTTKEWEKKRPKLKLPKDIKEALKKISMTNQKENNLGTSGKTGNYNEPVILDITQQKLECYKKGFEDGIGKNISELERGIEIGKNNYKQSLKREIEKLEPVLLEVGKKYEAQKTFDLKDIILKQDIINLLEK